MNGISTNKSNEMSAFQSASSQKESETTGSLAMMDYGPLFSVPPVYNYDMFIPTNPFSLNIDFSSYSKEGRANLANNSAFMQGFANAMAALSEGASYGSFGGAGCGSVASSGFSGGSCSMGGGFTSVG